MSSIYSRVRPCFHRKTPLVAPDHGGPGTGLSAWRARRSQAAGLASFLCLGLHQLPRSAIARREQHVAERGHGGSSGKQRLSTMRKGGNEKHSVPMYVHAACVYSQLCLAAVLPPRLTPLRRRRLHAAQQRIITPLRN